MSKACTKGTPAVSMVANCRLKTAMSLVTIFFLPAANSGFGFFLILTTRIPWRRSSARAISSLREDNSPFRRAPLRSAPSQTNKMAAASSFAMAINPA